MSKTYIKSILFTVLVTVSFPAISNEIEGMVNFKRDQDRVSQEFEDLNTCVDSSISSIAPTSESQDSLFKLFADNGKDCVTGMIQNAGEDMLPDSMCDCYTRKNDEFLKWQVDNVVSANVDKEVEELMNENLIEGARSRYIEAFELAQYVERLVNEGKLKPGEVTGLAACSAEAMTAGIFDEVNSRDEKSCPKEKKEKGLKRLFGSSDKNAASNFFSRQGNKLALNAILPEDREAGMCFGNNIVNTFSQPSLEAKNIFSDNFSINPFDPEQNQNFSTLEEFTRSSRPASQKHIKFQEYFWDDWLREGEEFKPSHIRALRLHGDDYNAFINKNPLIRIAGNNPVLYGLLKRMPHSKWKSFLERPENLNKLIDEPKKICSDLSVGKDANTNDGKGGDNRRKTMGDIICGTHKPKISGASFVNNIVPKLWDSAGEEKGNLIAINYITTNYCSIKKNKKGKDRPTPKDKVVFNGGDFEEKFLKLGAITKTELEKDIIPEKHTSSKSQYKSLNETLCTSDNFKGCPETPNEPRCKNIDTILANFKGKLTSIIDNEEIELSDISFSTYELDEDGIRVSFTPKTKEELVDFLLKNPEMYGEIATLDISDKAFSDIKNILTASNSFTNMKNRGLTEFDHFSTIGKESNPDRPNTLGIIANTSVEQSRTLTDHHEVVRSTPEGKEPPPIPYDSQLSSDRVSSVINTPTNNVSFGDANNGSTEQQAPDFKPVEVKPGTTPSSEGTSGEPTGNGGVASKEPSKKEPAKTATSSSRNSADKSLGIGETKKPNTKLAEVQESQKVEPKEKSSNDNGKTKESGLSSSSEYDLKKRLVEEMEANNALKNRLADVEALSKGSKGQINDDLKRKSRDLRNQIANLDNAIENSKSAIKRNDYDNKVINGRPYSEGSGDPYRNIYGGDENSDLVAGEDEERDEEKDESDPSKKGKSAKNSSSEKSSSKEKSGASVADSNSSQAFEQIFGKDGINSKEYKNFGKKEYHFSLIYDGEYVSKIGLDNFIKIKHLEAMSFRTIERGQTEDSWTLRIFDYVVRDAEGVEIPIATDTGARLRLKKSFDIFRPMEILLDQNKSLSESMREYLSHNGLEEKHALAHMSDARARTDEIKSQAIDKETYEAHKKYIVNISLNEKLLSDYRDMIAKKKAKNARVTSAD